MSVASAKPWPRCSTSWTSKTCTESLFWTSAQAAACSVWPHADLALVFTRSITTATRWPAPKACANASTLAIRCGPPPLRRSYRATRCPHQRPADGDQPLRAGTALDPEFARNARLLHDDGKIYRVSQARSFSTYGAWATVSEVKTLSLTHYEEDMVSQLKLGFDSRASGLHHLQSCKDFTVWDQKHWERAR